MQDNATLRKTISIDSESAIQRIDNFLVRHFKNVPKSHIYKLLRKGAIRVNGKKVKAEYKLQAEDQIQLPQIVQEAKAAPKKAKTNTLELLESVIVYEDDDLIILNKPAHIAVHAGSGVALGVIEIMRQARPQLKDLELVHRLDRETSGLLMLAKKRSVLRELHDLIRLGKIHKSYMLLAKGPWQGGTRKVNLALAKNKIKSGERIVDVSEDGKQSITIFHPKHHYTKSNVVLLEAELKTGRTHQIRVHAAKIGHPIVGDEKYGEREFNRAMQKLGIKNLCLQAYHLRFKWKQDKWLDIKIPLPEFFQLQD